MTKPLPVLFIGHGSPMNAIEDNEFSIGWQEAAEALPKNPKAILCISAHWETWGTLVTAMEKPRTIHDFGGFPKELFEVTYPAPGSRWLAQEVKNIVKKADVGLDNDWGLDHGCWSVLKRMFPDANVPVVQMSLDYARPAQDHYDMAGELAPLREKGVLIIGSGNMVHNLGRIVFRGSSMSDFNKPFGLTWALEADKIFKQLISENNHRKLIDYQSLGNSVQLAIPSPEHYLPMLYVLALKQEGESVNYFNDKPVAGSLTMTSLIIK
ncbi:MAG: 4,5-DOPA dioxygenase extradiol [Chitinispirillaceae bacterium]|jgi:4,5-DOPA dioxygenase extradiol